MVKRLRRYWSLPLAERVLLARAFAYLWVLTVALRLFGFRALIQRAPSADGPSTDKGLQRARGYAGLIERASRYHVVRARCLQCSLALHYWLRREGLPSELRIGVRTAAGTLQAHAWVELDGVPVGDTDGSIAPFTPLFTSGAGERLASAMHGEMVG